MCIRVLAGAATGLLLLATLGCTVTDGAVARGSPITGSCGWSSSLADRNPPGQLDRGILAVPGFPTHDIGTDSDLDWTADPFTDPSWTLWYASLKWAEGLVTSGDGSQLRRALAITQDFLADNPDPGSNTGTWRDHATSLRTSYLLCLYQAAPGETWLLSAITGHADALDDRYAGPYNHGTMQNIALMAAGCTLDRSDWRERAGSRLEAEAATAIDGQGVLEEQATGYSSFLWGLWTTVLELAEDCHTPPPEGLEERLAAMDEFSAHATTPDGRVVPIGDSWPDIVPSKLGPASTYAGTRGRSGTRPARTFATFDRGYAFGRDSWTDPEHQYSVRYGPGRYRHGHNDHLGVTYWSRGGNVLVDAGYAGYADRGFRAWSISPEAHNVPVLPGVEFDESATTTLERVSDSAGLRSIELRDTAYAGTQRARSVVADDVVNALVVRDNVTTDRDRRVRLVWHLDPSWTFERHATIPGQSITTFLSPDRQTRAWIIQATPPGQLLSPTSRVHRGEREPYQGWVSRGHGEMTPAWVVENGHVGSQVDAATVIVSAPVDEQVRLSPSRLSGNRGRLTLRVGEAARTLEADGQRFWASGPVPPPGETRRDRTATTQTGEPTG